MIRVKDQSSGKIWTAFLLCSPLLHPYKSVQGNLAPAYVIIPCAYPITVVCPWTLTILCFLSAQLVTSEASLLRTSLSVAGLQTGKLTTAVAEPSAVECLELVRLYWSLPIQHKGWVDKFIAQIKQTI